MTFKPTPLNLRLFVGGVMDMCVLVVSSSSPHSSMDVPLTVTSDLWILCPSTSGLRTARLQPEYLPKWARGSAGIQSFKSLSKVDIRIRFIIHYESHL